MLYAPIPYTAAAMGMVGALVILILGIAVWTSGGQSESTLIQDLEQDHILIRIGILYVGLTGTASMVGFVVAVLRGKYDRD